MLRAPSALGIVQSLHSPLTTTAGGAASAALSFTAVISLTIAFTVLSGHFKSPVVVR